MAKLKIGYVPEHFSTPLAFAQKHFGLDAELEPVPLGTGHLTARLKAPKTDDSHIDVAVGLTEGFVADLGKEHAAGKDAEYGLVGTYVQSPLCWAISTGAGRKEITSVKDLKRGKVGVSRIGSGSYVMSYVLGDEQGWLDPTGTSGPFEVKTVGDFAALRSSVNSSDTDFFMWEHFTTKKFWDNGEIKRIGEIYTPWPSWMIAARRTAEPQIQEMIEKVNQGVKYYKEHPEEAIEYITGNMHYSEEDAREWAKTVRFPDDVTGVENHVVGSTIAVLKKAGVLKDDAGGARDMIYIEA